MKRILFTLLLASAACAPVISQAAELNIAVGDQGYYTHGATYVSGGYNYAWVPGHWSSKHHWVHGRYVRRERVGVGVGVGVGIGGVGVGVGVHP